MDVVTLVFNPLLGRQSSILKRFATRPLLLRKGSVRVHCLSSLVSVDRPPVPCERG